MSQEITTGDNEEMCAPRRESRTEEAELER